MTAPSEDLAKTANQAFEKYLQLQGEGRFEEAAQQLGILQETLKKMVEKGDDGER